MASHRSARSRVTTCSLLFVSAEAGNASSGNCVVCDASCSYASCAGLALSPRFQFPSDHAGWRWLRRVQDRWLPVFLFLCHAALRLFQTSQLQLPVLTVL